jgi:hypothetical protein
MLQVDAQMGHGFVIILGGMTAIAPANNKKKQQSRGKNKIDDDNAVMLGYLALTEGNVIDACFGIKNQADKSKKTSMEQAKKVKRLISNAADSSGQIEFLHKVLQLRQDSTCSGNGAEGRLRAVEGSSCSSNVNICE